MVLSTPGHSLPALRQDVGSVAASPAGQDAFWGPPFLLSNWNPKCIMPSNQEGTTAMARLIIIFLALLILAPGFSCQKSTSVSKPPQSKTATTAQQTASLPAATMPANLAGMRFVSREKHEGGMTPRGMAMGYWHLEFRESSCGWDNWDVREGCRYHLFPDGRIEASCSGRPIVGQYDPDRKQVKWDGFWYVNETITYSAPSAPPSLLPP